MRLYQFLETVFFWVRGGSYTTDREVVPTGVLRNVGTEVKRTSGRPDPVSEKHTYTSFIA